MKIPTTPLIIAATIAIAIGPLFVGFFGPASDARWLLARAANEYQDGKPDQARKTLEKAAATSQDIFVDADFWKLRFQMTFDKKTVAEADVQTLYESSVASLSGMESTRKNAVLEFLAALFKEHGRLDLAVGLLEANLPPIAKRPPLLNNDLAYFRALAKKDLDIALQEIDAALKVEVNPGFLDTKGWVLHGLRKDELAWKFANESVKRQYDALGEIRGLFEPGPSDTKIGVQTTKVDLPSTTSEPSKPDKTSESETAQSDPAGEPEAKESDSETQKIEPSQELTKELSKALLAVNKLDEIKKKFPSSEHIKLERLARTLAVLRFHRACILDELGRGEEAEIDYDWLDRFGFSDVRLLD
jgi:hypothetical protein